MLRWSTHTLSDILSSSFTPIYTPIYTCVHPHQVGRVLHPHLSHDNDGRRGPDGSLGGGTRNVTALQHLWGMQSNERERGEGEEGEHDDYDSEEGDDDDVKGAAR